MPIQQTAQPEEKQENKPLLSIQLPAATSGNPSEPLTIGQHNASAKRNFEQVANLMLAVINNQKLMSLAITQHDEAIKEFRSALTQLNDNIRKLLETNEQPTKPAPKQ